MQTTENLKIGMTMRSNRTTISLFFIILITVFSTFRIVDTSAKKPDDWDEDAPEEIDDLDAKKPDDWLDDEPEYVPDETKSKPDDW